MGGVPAAMGNAASTVGNGVSNAAQSFWGAAKDSVNNNFVDPIKNGISDIRGHAGSPPMQAPGTPPVQGAPPAPGTPPPPSGAVNPAMQKFFNAPAAETPAMRLRRQASQQ